MLHATDITEWGTILSKHLDGFSKLPNFQYKINLLNRRVSTDLLLARKIIVTIVSELEREFDHELSVETIYSTNLILHCIRHQSKLLFTPLHYLKVHDKVRLYRGDIQLSAQYYQLANQVQNRIDIEAVATGIAPAADITICEKLLGEFPGYSINDYPALKDLNEFVTKLTNQIYSPPTTNLE